MKLKMNEKTYSFEIASWLIGSVVTANHQHERYMLEEGAILESLSKGFKKKKCKFKNA